MLCMAAWENQPTQCHISLALSPACSNVMEHVLDPSAYERLLQDPDTWRSQGYESAASAALQQGILTLKLLDWGHSGTCSWGVRGTASAIAFEACMSSALLNGREAKWRDPMA